MIPLGTDVDAWIARAGERDMTDEEAERGAWMVCRGDAPHGIAVYCFRAGLEHARKEGEQQRERFIKIDEMRIAAQEFSNERIAALERVVNAVRNISLTADRGFIPGGWEVDVALRALDALKDSGDSGSADGSARKRPSGESSVGFGSSEPNSAQPEPASLTDEAVVDALERELVNYADERRLALKWERECSTLRTAIECERARNARLVKALEPVTKLRVGPSGYCSYPIAKIVHGACVALEKNGDE